MNYRRKINMVQVIWNERSNNLLIIDLPEVSAIRCHIFFLQGFLHI